MIGTIVNTLCIVVGSVCGSVMRRGIGARYRVALFDALGVCTVLLGANAFVSHVGESSAPVLFIASMAVGSVVGCALRLDERFAGVVERLGKGSRAGAGAASGAGASGSGTSVSSSAPSLDASAPSSGGGRLAEGLSTGVLLYCVGTFSMLGPVLSALEGDNTYLYTNAMLDLVTSTVLAATYGIGMVWAAPVLFCWQGMFYGLALCSEDVVSGEVVCELSIVGGVIIAASGLKILGVRDIRTLNMLPAFLVPVVWFVLKWVVGMLM
ncbi:MAG: DUF554 domain-containing protein [Bacteroidaceae bacterium]|nr:DUF554 domain-containing protein [Bacteroidaceae bacterium]